MFANRAVDEERKDAKGCQHREPNTDLAQNDQKILDAKQIYPYWHEVKRSEKQTASNSDTQRRDLNKERKRKPCEPESNFRWPSGES